MHKKWIAVHKTILCPDIHKENATRLCILGIAVLCKISAGMQCLQVLLLICCSTSALIVSLYKKTIQYSDIQCMSDTTKNITLNKSTQVLVANRIHVQYMHITFGDVLIFYMLRSQEVRIQYVQYTNIHVYQTKDSAQSGEYCDIYPGPE